MKKLKIFQKVDEAEAKQADKEEKKEGANG